MHEQGSNRTHLLFYVLNNILQRHRIGEVPLQSLQAILSFQQVVECTKQVAVGTIDAMHARRKDFVVARLSVLPPEARTVIHYWRAFQLDPTDPQRPRRQAVLEGPYHDRVQGLLRPRASKMA